MSKTKLIITLLRLSISFGIIYWLIRKIGLVSILDTFRMFNLLYLLPVLLIFGINFAIAAFNLKIIIHALKKRMSFLKIFNYSMLSWSTGLFIPGKLGEASLIYLLAKGGLDVSTSLVVTLVDKTLSVFVFFIIGLVGSLILFPQANFSFIIFLAAIAFFLILVVFFFTFRSKFITWAIPYKYRSKIDEFSNSLNFLLKRRKSILFFNFLLTLLKWFVFATGTYFIFLGFGLEIDIFTIFFINGILLIITHIPITISGLGILQASSVFLYGLLSYPADIVLSASLVDAVLFYTIALLCISFLPSKIE